MNKIRYIVHSEQNMYAQIPMNSNFKNLLLFKNFKLITRTMNINHIQPERPHTFRFALI